MIAFRVLDGPCGAGPGQYRAGCLILPDGTTRGIETVATLSGSSPGGGASGLSAGIVGSLNALLPGQGGRALPLRLALAGMRAGLGAVADELAPGGAATTEIVFQDGTRIEAALRPDERAVLLHDRDLALGVLARRQSPAASADLDPAQQEALTSIFRYEKRQGRLRRVTGSETP